MAVKRTTHRSVAGKKLYAVRNAEGQIKDIQTFERAHRQDVKRTSKDEAVKAAGAKTLVKKKVAAKTVAKKATKPVAPKAAAKVAPKATKPVAPKAAPKVAPKVVVKTAVKKAVKKATAKKR